MFGDSDADKDDFQSGMIDSKGRYVSEVIGESPSPNYHYEFGLMRYSPDGTLDTSFGGNGTGYVIYQHGGAGIAGAPVATRDDEVGFASIAQDHEGRYVSTGYSTNAAGGNYELFLIRYTEAGILDTTFGSGSGTVLYNHNGIGISGRANASKKDYGNTILIDSQDRYVVIAQSRNAAGGYELAILRYNNDGSLDSTFGTGGVSLFQPGGTGAAGQANATRRDGDYAGGIIDIDGKIVVAADSFNSASASEAAIWRFNTDGSLDTSFGGGGGYVLLQHNGTGAAGASNSAKEDAISGIAQTADGGYVTAGSSANASQGSKELMIWKTLADGSLDTSFASTGFALFQHNGNGASGASNANKDDGGGSIFIDASGNYLVQGGTKINGGSGDDLATGKYKADGSLDTHYGTAGVFVARLNQAGISGAPNSSDDSEIENAVLDAYGRFVIFGSTLNSAGGYTPANWRITNNGTLDQ